METEKSKKEQEMTVSEKFSIKKREELLTELNSLGESHDAEARKKEKIALLHEYNDVKDATQTIIGAVANIDQVTIKSLHLKYNLPLD